MEPLQFTQGMLTPDPTSGIDVKTTLAHFAIITYLVDPEKLRPHIHDRFELVTITTEEGETRALVSVVPFLDQDFRFLNCPWPKWVFGQTNYRAYVIDSETGEHCVWFFGTSLDTLTIFIPKNIWKLPWYKARIHYDCQFDQQQNRFTKYQMKTRSDWAPAELEIEDSGTPVETLDGFPDLETGLVILTHPTKGYFNRRDGKLGTYSIWHDRLQLTSGKLVKANFGLLNQLELIPEGDLNSIHSVLLTKSTEFIIYLPPRLV